jgi:hypothetical protein
MNGDDRGLPIESFIQALTSQLDRAQSAIALKARAGMPLTFAVKEMSLELRAHLEMVRSVVHIRPAQPRDREASVLHIQLTTITRPMMEENTIETVAEPGEPSLREMLGEEISEEEERRLEWAGVHTASQLLELGRRTGGAAIARISQVPAERLQAALRRAQMPAVSELVADRPLPSAPPRAASPSNGPLDGPATRAPAGQRVLRIRGRNLVEEGQPQVRVDGERVPVLEATRRELVVAAPTLRRPAGRLEIETRPGLVATAQFSVDDADESGAPAIALVATGGAA